jgi:internalin A
MPESLHPKSRRSWLRLSVRGLVILVLLIGCWLGWEVHQAQVQREAVAAIRRANGNVEYNLDPSRSPWWLRWLADRIGLDYISHVVRVDLVGVGPDGPSTGAELDHVVRLTRIEQLGLWETSISDARLADLGGLTRLRSLGLHKTRVGDQGLANLKGLPALRVLWLNRSAVTDAGLAHLEDRTDLEALSLRETAITDAGLVHLKGLSNLKRLFIGGTKITDAGLVHLRGLKRLQELEVGNTRVTDTAVRELQRALPSLKISRL